MFAGAVAIVLALSASPAVALTVTSSAVDHLDAADVQVNVAASDATGTVLLEVDGKAWATRGVRPGTLEDFGDLRLPAGAHRIRALLRSGGTVRASSVIDVKVWTAPAPTALVSPTPNGYSAQYVAGAIKPGPCTTLVEVYLNGKFLKTTSVVENTLQNIGTLGLSTGVNTVDLVAVNPVAETKSSYTVTRLDYPWPTCIIIDKSDFRLYWIRDGVLVKVYPIAIGKASTPTPVGTWKVGNKYITSPTSVYGPRKMRLWRQTGSTFKFTAYAVHGTNQEWVIGTMASHGCIRMYNKDVIELYPQVPLGTMVQTRQ